VSWRSRLRAWPDLWPGASGPAVAGLFTRLFAVVLMAAWLSLAAQIRVLIGTDGLLPLRELIESAQGQGGLGSVSFLRYPSFLRWSVLAGDGALLAGTLLGAGLGLLALLGVWPRLAFFLSTFLYLGYASATRGFLDFQWDNLLLECGLLASFLPRDRASPAVHLLFRLLLFKLYFESGIAKWQSSIGDWHDGSAMAFYYETAPLPTWLGFYAHNLPTWWHHVESRAALALELVFPFAIFGPRRARLIAAVAFTSFQLIDAATANYGFFCHLAAVLHLFLLDDQDLLRARAWVSGRLPAAGMAFLRRFGRSGPPRAAPPAPAAPPRFSRLRRGLAATGLAAYLGISLVEALQAFGPRSDWLAVFRPLERVWSPLRLVNTYHLFASVTRERIEPQIEILEAGAWREHDLRYKPGDPGRAPPFVAPHQPRVDFLLWFHGLGWRQAPAYLLALLDRICHRPAAVQPLFAGTLPARPGAVRVAYHRYRFATLAERRATRRYWNRSLESRTGEVTCDR
jgi:lipase maturation factor 1